MKALVRRILPAIAAAIPLCLFSSDLFAVEVPKPVSVVDYMKSVGLDSDFANRKAIYTKQWSAEKYTGTAEQNVKLLKHLLGSRKNMLLPFPSSSIDGCKEFYSNPEVSRYLAVAFQKNAVSACIVTGTETPQNTIRIKLQEIYLSTKPASGSVFMPDDHKAIHVEAYIAPECKEGEST